jgi:OmpA-OmpF porin, OOP family
LHGCPPAQLVGSQIQILGRVDFELRLAQLLPESESVLMSVLQVLQNHSGIKRLRVEGHTDNRGSVQHNFGLSLKRAEAVVAWLTRKGVDPSRLVAKGWGSQKPIDTNDSEDGRRNNRRVEFRVLEFEE